MLYTRTPEQEEIVVLSRSFTHQIHPSKSSDSQTDEIGQIRNSYRRQNAGQFVLTRMLPDGVRTQKYTICYSMVG